MRASLYVFMFQRKRPYPEWGAHAPSRVLVGALADRTAHLRRGGAILAVRLAEQALKERGLA